MLCCVVLCMYVFMYLYIYIQVCAVQAAACECQKEWHHVGNARIEYICAGSPFEAMQAAFVDLQDSETEKERKLEAEDQAMRLMVPWLANVGGDQEVQEEVDSQENNICASSWGVVPQPYTYIYICIHMYTR